MNSLPPSLCLPVLHLCSPVQLYLFMIFYICIKTRNQKYLKICDICLSETRPATLNLFTVMGS